MEDIKIPELCSDHKTIFHAVDSVTGSGKTDSAIEFCGFGAMAGEQFMIAQPTTELIEKTMQRFRDRWKDIKVNAIHGETSVKVSVDIGEHAKDADGGENLFLTHQALLQTYYIHHKHEWHLVVDEMPTVIWDEKLVIPDNVTAMPSLRVEQVNERYSEVFPLDTERWKQMSQNRKHDMINKVFQEFATLLMSGNWHLYVLNAQWERLKAPGDGVLLVFGLLRPDVFTGFASTTFMAANMRNSLAYQYFETQGITFHPHTPIMNRLRYTSHQNGHLLHIYYALDTTWSKHLRNKVVDVDGLPYTVNQIIVDATLKLFGEDEFVKLYNNDLIRDDPFGGKGEMLPSVSHGRNDFQSFHNGVILSALNPTPAFYAFLAEIAGLHAAQVRQAIYYEAVYQSAGRISLRNVDDLSPKRIVVADLKAAEFLQSMYPGASIERLAGTEKMLIENGLLQKRGRPAKYDTEEDRKIAQRQQQAQSKRRSRWKERVLDENNVLKSTIEHFVRHGVRERIACSPEWTKTSGFELTTWDSRAATFRPYEDFEVQYDRHLIAQSHMTTEEFFADLKHRSETNHYDRKELNNLFSPALFDLSRDLEHGHSLSNVVAIKGVVLDMDGTQMAPETSANALPNRMMIYSSWSHQPDDISYRVCIPTTEHMTKEVNRAIKLMCLRAFEQAGYALRGDIRHKVDTTKLHGASMFYYPCVRDGGFCTEFNEQGAAIDPIEWINRCPNDIIDRFLEPEPDKPLHEPETNFTGTIEAAITYWHMRGCIRGRGRSQLWFLAIRLAQAGLSESEMRNALYEQAGYSTNPTERRSEIDGLLTDPKVKAAMTSQA